MVLGVVSMFYVGGTKAAIARFQGQSDVSPLAVLALGCFWWWATAVILERQASDPAEPAAARALNQRIGRSFIMAPVFAFVMAYTMFSLTLQAAQMFLFGQTTGIVARVEETKPKGARNCRYSVRLHPPAGADFTACLSRRLHRSLSPGDGLNLRVRLYRDRLLPRGMDRVPPDEVPPEGTVPPDLVRFLLNRSAASAAAD